MAGAPKIDWAGKSGKKYTYLIYKIGTSFVAKPGNYIFATQPKANTCGG